MISPHEADILLLTELDGRSKGNVYMPRNFCPPPPMPDTHYPSFVDISWVQIAHKYTIAYELICHCLELCGLRKETVKTDNPVQKDLYLKMVFYFCRTSLRWTPSNSTKTWIYSQMETTPPKRNEWWRKSKKFAYGKSVPLTEIESSAETTLFLWPAFCLLSINDDWQSSKFVLLYR